MLNFPHVSSLIINPEWPPYLHDNNSNGIITTGLKNSTQLLQVLYFPHPFAQFLKNVTI